VETALLELSWTLALHISDIRLLGFHLVPQQLEPARLPILTFLGRLRCPIISKTYLLYAIHQKDGM
jgi:hypothetical protein